MGGGGGGQGCTSSRGGRDGAAHGRVLDVPRKGLSLVCTGTCTLSSLATRRARAGRVCCMCVCPFRLGPPPHTRYIYVSALSNYEVKILSLVRVCGTRGSWHVGLGRSLVSLRRAPARGAARGRAPPGGAGRARSSHGHTRSVKTVVMRRTTTTDVPRHRELSRPQGGRAVAGPRDARGCSKAVDVDRIRDSSPRPVSPVVKSS